MTKMIDEIVKDRIRKIESYCVITHQIKDIINDMKEQRELAKTIGYSEQPNSILVIAETGMGKTKLIKEYLQKNQPYVDKSEEGERTIAPVLSVSLPDDRGSRAAPMAILRQLGDDLYNKGTRLELNDRFEDMAKSCGVELIIIDEFQNAIESGTDKVVYKVADWLKTIINRTNIPVVILGMPWAQDVLSVNSQLESRFPIKHHIKMYGKDNFADWIKFLIKLDKNLPFNEPIGLKDPALAFRLLAISNGKIGALMKNVIRPAARRAAFEGLDSVPISYMLESSIKLCGVPEEANPLSLQHVPISAVTASYAVSESVYNRNGKKGESRIKEAEYGTVKFADLTASEAINSR